MTATFHDPPIPFAQPDVDEREAEAVAEVLRSGWLTSGARARRFEQELAEKVGARHAVATSSCTAALQLALASLDAPAGSAVLTPTYNFTSAAEVALQLGLEPVLVDVEPGRLLLDPERLAEKLAELRLAGRRACAVIPVHLAGHPADLDAIDTLAAEHGLAVIEDAAHALPSAWRGRPVGSRRPSSQSSGQPHAVCYSFYANKTLTTGEGGMLVTDDAEVAARCRRLSLHGVDAPLWERERGSERPGEGGAKLASAYEVVEPGFKANLSDLAAAVGLVQLGKLEAMSRRRAEIAARYSAAFADEPRLETPTVAAEAETSWHLYLLRLDPKIGRDLLAQRLRQRGIGTSVHYRPLHLHRGYGKLGHRPEDFPVALAEWRRVISLPIYSRLADSEVERVIAAVLEEGAELQQIQRRTAF